MTLPPPDSEEPRDLSSRRGGGRGRRGGLRPRHLALTVVLVLLVIFILENLSSVPLRFIGPRVHAPLSLALLISAVLGVLIGLLARHRRRR